MDTRIFTPAKWIFLCLMTYSGFCLSAQPLGGPAVNFGKDPSIPSVRTLLASDTGHAWLNVNNINALFFARGSHFFYENAAFEVPKGSGKTSAFSNTMWIGGKDSQGVLHFAGERYRQGPNTGIAGSCPDFYCGPVMDPAYYSAYQDSLWSHVWNLKKTEIEYHKAHYADPGYQPLTDILTWPGNGNTAMGQASQLAPFFDVNGDGIYSPMDGDYPLMRGDQALFFIFNDDRGPHLETLGNKLGLEFHGMAYAWDLPNDSAFKNTVFLNYQIFNRSQNTYDSVYLGVFTDVDIGYPNDDYVGCDVERNIHIGYNGTPVDGYGESYAYGANPPSLGVVILAGPYMDPDGIDNPKYDSYGHRLCDYSVNGQFFGDSIVDNERLGMCRFEYTNNSGVPPYMLDPGYDYQYYSYMKGLWLDGTPFLYGGNGHASTGAYGPACRFMFPGESDSLNWGTGGIPPYGPKNWTDSSAGNSPGDRRGVQVSGPFTFNAGAVQEFDLSFNWARDYNSKSAMGSVSKLKAMTDIVNQAFVTNTLPGGGTFTGIPNRTSPYNIGLNIFPNPARDKINIELPGRDANQAVTVELLNMAGQLLKTLTPGSSLNTIAIDIADVPGGICFVRVKTSSSVITRKIVILK